MKANFALPAQNIPIQKPTGEIDPTWYEKLKTIEAFMNMFAYVDFPAATSRTPPASAQIADGQVLVFNAATGQFLPHAN
jgi:hypothetical protein